MPLKIPDYAQVRIDMLSQGNRRACGICRELFNKYGGSPLIALEKLGINGSAIWALYFNHCKGNLDVMKAELDRRYEEKSPPSDSSNPP